MIKLLICSIFIILSVQANAQYYKGDFVADMVLGKAIYQKNKLIKISDFKDQFIIMDIMSINCSSCLKALPKYDSIQSILQSKVKLLIIVTDPQKDARNFFIKMGYNKLKNLNFIAASEELLYSFNINTTPFHVWLSPNRQVKAITNAEYVNLKNIEEQLFNSQPALWADISLPPYEPLFTLDQVKSSPSKPVYFSLFQGYLQGVKTAINFTEDSVNNCLLWELNNLSIISLYNIALKGLGYEEFIGQRFQIELAESATLKYNPNKDYRDAWKRKNNFSINYSLPLNTPSQQRFEKLWSDLNLFTGLKGTIEKRQFTCLLIKDSANKLRPSQSFNEEPIPKKELKLTLKELVQILNRENHQGVFLLDNIQVEQQIIISYEALKNPGKLVGELNNNGFSLNLEERLLDVFVLSK